MLPIDIKEDNSKSLYIIYDINNLIVEKWSREPHANDTKAQTDKDGVVKLPQFYGEWVQTPQEEIDKLNESILAKKPNAVHKALHNSASTSEQVRPAKKLTQREILEQRTRQELEKMLKLLNEKKEVK